MFNLNLKRKLLLSVGIALIGVTLLLSGFAYRALREQVIDGSYAQITHLSERSAIAIAEWLDGKKTAIASLKNSGRYQDPQSLHLVLEATDFISIYHGSKQGVMLDDDPGDDAEDYQGYDPRTKEWYQTASGSSEPVLTKPYKDETYVPAEIVLSVVQPTADGVLGGDISTKRLQQNLSEMKLPAGGFGILVDRQGNVVAYKDQKHVLKPLSELLDGVDMSRLATSTTQQTPLITMSAGKEKLLWARPIANSQWLLLSVVDKQRLFAPLQQHLIQQLIISVLILLISQLAIGALIGILIRPLRNVSAALAHISSGDGDLTQRIQVSSEDEVGELANNFNRFIGTLHTLISGIRKEAVDMEHCAGRGLAQADNSHRQVTRQEQEITQVATAVTQMASATQEIAQHAEQTAAAAQSSSQSTQQGGQLVEKTRHSITLLADEVEQATTVINELNQHAQAISSVLTTIKSIAEQTNLLALNAAIEAARAGEQGRGFAVVADEVRVLSHRTHASTTEIQGTIATLQASTASAVAMMQQSRGQAEQSVQDADAASSALGEITAAIAVISDMSTQIATAAEEQHKVTDEITRNVHEIKDLADQLTQDAEEGAAQAREQQQLASSLNGQVSLFRL